MLHFSLQCIHHSLGIFVLRLAQWIFKRPRVKTQTTECTLNCYIATWPLFPECWAPPGSVNAKKIFLFEKLGHLFRTLPVNHTVYRIQKYSYWTIWLLRLSKLKYFRSKLKFNCSVITNIIFWHLYYQISDFLQTIWGIRFPSKWDHGCTN